MKKSQPVTPIELSFDNSVRLEEDSVVGILEAELHGSKENFVRFGGAGGDEPANFVWYERRIVSNKLFHQ